MQKRKQLSLLEGDQLHTSKLTRLEWLVEEMNSRYSIKAESADYFILSFCLERENAITIYIECVKQLSEVRLEVENYVGRIMEALFQQAKVLKWLEWLMYDIYIEDPIGDQKAMQRAIEKRRRLLQR